MIIGLTGGIGSGKTAIAKIFSRHGYMIIDADRIAHRLLSKKEVRPKILREFGTADRKKIAEIVFSDKAELKKLNRIMWPAIGKEIKAITSSKKKKDIIIDAAVLIEAGWHKAVDKVIVAKISKSSQIKRLINTGRYDKKIANKIIKLQLPQNKRLSYADCIIDNNSSLKNTERQVNCFISQLRK